MKAEERDKTIYLEDRKRLTQRVQDMIIQRLNLDLQPHQIDKDAPLFALGLGLDSVDALELIIGVEQEFGQSVQNDQKNIIHSVNTIVDFIMNQNRKKTI